MEWMGAARKLEGKRGGGKLSTSIIVLFLSVSLFGYLLKVSSFLRTERGTAVLLIMARLTYDRMTGADPDRASVGTETL